MARFLRLVLFPTSHDADVLKSRLSKVTCNKNNSNPFTKSDMPESELIVSYFISNRNVEGFTCVHRIYSIYDVDGRILQIPP